ncbi:MAG TPA: DUF885 domain-containing protein [Anaerolineae bacterium]|nr:DUF885 domain-containing protein [Anaerolineae bacterium]
MASSSLSKLRILIYLTLCLSALFMTGCGVVETTLLPATNTPAASFQTPDEIPDGTRSLTPTSTSTPLQPTLDPSISADLIAPLEGLPIDAFFDQSYRLLQLRDPDTIILNGLADEYGISNDRFTDFSDAYVRETQQLEVAILALLRAYDRDALGHSQQIFYDVYEWMLEDHLRGHAFMYYDYPVNSMTIWGKQNWLVDFMVNHQPITCRQDAEDYITRLSQIDTWVDQLLEGLQLREQAGIVPPRFVLQDSRAQLEAHLHMQGASPPEADAVDLYVSFQDKLNALTTIDATEKQNLLDAALQAIDHTFIPAFLELRDYLRRLEIVASNVSGVHQFPEGRDYYAYMLNHEANTQMTPDQIHALGTSEVERLQSEIQAAAVSLGYPPDISMAELNQRLMEDDVVIEGDALLDEYEDLIAKAEQATHDFFHLLPQTELVILPEPFGSGIGYYLPPPLDGSGPGGFYTNLDAAIPSHIIPTYIYHETVPGHHLQGALARELDLPTFMRELELNAFLEGWALYAERLAWEMGLYEDDPWGNMGRLLLEQSRAARLVIDTGIHAMGWSRHEAASYYAEVTGRPSSSGAMDRYVILPGQGCGYTIGLLKILDLRQRAMEQLGDAFDIREFHDVILSNGSVPLEILEEIVTDWIATQSRE